MWQSCTVQIACYCRHGWIPLIRTWSFRILPYLNSKSFPLDLPFRHLLWVISNSCYFKPFYITSKGWKQQGSTVSMFFNLYSKIIHSATLNELQNTYKETENRSSWSTEFVYDFISSVCSYSKMMTSNLSWWCHNINMSTTVCYY